MATRSVETLSNRDLRQIQMADLKANLHRVSEALANVPA